MHVSDLIKELASAQEEWGDLRVVLLDGFGSRVGCVGWDEGDNGETVIVVGD